MPLFFTQTLAILQKDLKTEWRTRERLSAMAFFALLIVIIFNFIYEPGSPIIKTVAPGIFWIATAFAGLLGLSRSYAIDTQNDCLISIDFHPH